MTVNSAFKKRVRARMKETGEKYAAARRVACGLLARDEGRAYAAVNTLWSLRHGGAWPLLSRYSRGMLELTRDRRRHPRPTGEL